MQIMKKFLAIYLGSGNKMKEWQPKEGEMEAAMQAWSKWATDNSANIVDQGSPLGKTKHIDKSGITDTHNELGAWTVVQAESYEAAAQMFENHPHFTMFPGESVEIMECLPMPKM
ncbi:hypothetical protein H7X87_00890 [Acetobacteraceae bacterium]|nr:hypothetical protein [Candidatus Parcubacteria bacterium]